MVSSAAHKTFSVSNCVFRGVQDTLSVSKCVFKGLRTQRGPEPTAMPRAVSTARLLLDMRSLALIGNSGDEDKTSEGA
eukprot:11810528-Karenia_brevis.AAC.1